MKLRDLKISAQLLLGFACMLSFVILLGVVSVIDSNKIHQQTELIYNHPLKVRRAIGALQADILTMRLGTRDLMLATLDTERREAKSMIAVADAHARVQFEILKSQYLGPTENVEEAFDAYIKWQEARDENIDLAMAGETEKVKNSISSSGHVGKLRDTMLQKIEVIDHFARNKTDNLYNKSEEIKSSLTIRLGIIVFTTLMGTKK